MSGGGGCGKCCGYAKEVVGTVAKFGEDMVKWARGVELLSPRGRMSGPGAGYPGRRISGDTGRMSGLWIGTEHDELHGRNCNSGAKLGQIGGWKSRERWGKARST